MIRGAKAGDRVRSLHGAGYESTERRAGVLTGLWPAGCTEGVVERVITRPGSAVTSLIYVKGDHPRAVGAVTFSPKDLERVK